MMILLAFLAGCSFNFKDLPELPVSEEYSFKNIETTEEQVLPWWNEIDDPLFLKWLSELRNNFQLKSASENVLQSREHLKQSRGSFLPVIDLVASPTRSRSNLSSFGAIGNKIPNSAGSSKIYNTNYNLSLRTTWQIDLFGKLRSLNSLAEKRYLLSKAEKQSLLNTLVTDLYNLRVLLPNLYHQKLHQEKIIENLEIKLKLLEARYARGAGVTLELIQLTREELNQASLALVPLKLDLKRSRLALSLLLGKEHYPVRLKKVKFYKMPESLSIPQPLAILDQHPSILANQLKVLAAEANLDVAISALYPDLSLSFNYGYNSREANDFFRAENLVWSLVGNLATRVFSAGKLNSDVDIAESELRVMLNQYQEKVLKVLNEVKIAYQQDSEDHQAYLDQEVVTAQNKSLRESQEFRYQQGTLDLEKLINNRVSFEKSSKQLLAQRLKSEQSRIALYLSLGGHWNPEWGLNNNTKEKKTNEMTKEKIDE